MKAEAIDHGGVEIERASKRYEGKQRILLLKVKDNLT